MAEQNPFPWLVSPQWLSERLGRPRIRIVDGSFYLPAMKRDPAAEFLAGHIPGAVRFDVDEIADKSSSLPHMLPTPEAFAAAMGALGISDKDTIVVYDGAGTFSAPRVWWTFRLFGAKDVYILDGGMPRWKAETLPLESGAAKPVATTFNVKVPPAIVADVERVRKTLSDKSAQVVDARPADRFRGEAAERWHGLVGTTMRIDDACVRIRLQQVLEP